MTMARSTLRAMDPIVIEADAPDRLPIELVGKAYQINRPKTSAAIKLARAARDAEAKTAKNKGKKDGMGQLALLDAIDAYVLQVFGTKVGKQVLARLDDADDLLDVKHIVALMNALANYGSENPPTSPSDSSQ